MKMKFKISIFAGISLLSVFQLEAQKKPNVIFILADDLGYADLACYGNTFHETPVIDMLATKGIRFTNAYTACAVCSPTRASIQTGRYPVKTGVTDWIPGLLKENTKLETPRTKKFLDTNEITIGEVFKENGYRTAILGKWHLGEDEQHRPEKQGYDDVLLKEDWGYGRGYYKPAIDTKQWDTIQENLEYLNDRMNVEATKLLDKYAAEEAPFFMMLCYNAVHMPIQPPADLFGYYKNKKANGLWKKTDYAALTQSLDRSIGKVLQKLDELKLSENTIIVFTSDNGGIESQTNNYPYRSGKGYYYEGGLKVPLIVVWKGKIKENQQSDQRIISMDYFPTLLDLAGLPLAPKAHVDGQSFLKNIMEGRELSRDTLYWHYPHYHGAGETPCSSMILGNFKFIRHYEDNSKELYDLSNDIGEANNLAMQMPEKVNEMEILLDKWLKETGAILPKKSMNYNPQTGNAKMKKGAKKILNEE
jgi:arylsulfatase A